MKQKIKDFKSRKIVLTGGHAATTALSVVEEIVRRNNKREKIKWDIFWVGCEKAIEGENVPTLESEIFPKKGIKSFQIKTGRIQRKFTLWTIPSVAKIPIGFFQSYKVLKKIKPDVICSFGGFAAFPVVVIGYMLKIPIVIHEQTFHVGRANKISSVFAKKIALARKESLKYTNKKKAEVTGNPILTQISEIPPKNNMGDPPVIFIAGGSRGSRHLNHLIGEILNNLLDDFYVIHLTGLIDYKKTLDKKNELPCEKQERYEIYSRVDPMQIDGIYNRADIVLARAGANTVSEVIASKRPALFIPLPISHQKDQPANAQMAENYGIAKVLNQKNITGESLLNEIHLVKRNWKKMVTSVKNKKVFDKKASLRLVNLIEEISQ